MESSNHRPHSSFFYQDTSLCDISSRHPFQAASSWSSFPTQAASLTTRLTTSLTTSLMNRNDYKTSVDRFRQDSRQRRCRRNRQYQQIQCQRYWHEIPLLILRYLVFASHSRSSTEEFNEIRLTSRFWRMRSMTTPRLTLHHRPLVPVVQYASCQ